MTIEEQLRAIADAAASDIKGDHPEADVNYDMYIERMNNLLIGVIDMGDQWQEVYIFFENHGWEQSIFMGDPHDVINLILAKRSRHGW